MIMKKFAYILPFILLPVIASAASSNADDVIDYILAILNRISGILSSAAFAYFCWTLIKFIKNSQSGATDLKKSKDTLIWSAVALFMFIGIWSIVAYIQQSFADNGIDIVNSNIDRTPTLPETVD
jgi:TRAP-type C4-dicarboxylate transport system permease small subunit